jgi:peptidoglycan hydrolase-like protein with peptidoglycan-binding domain
MTKLHVAAALLAFGSLAALPACTSPSYSSAPPVQAAANPELSPGMVRQVQTALQQQGVYNGAIDGIWGPQTQAAVQSFQQSHSLRATGQLSSATLAALNLPADNTAAPAQQSSTAAPANQTNTATSATSTAPAPAPATTGSNGSTSTTTP